MRKKGYRPKNDPSSESVTVIVRRASTETYKYSLPPYRKPTRSKEEREQAAESLRNDGIGQSKLTMQEYRVSKIMERIGCTKDEARQFISERERIKIKKVKFGRRKKPDRKPTVYTVGGRVIATVVSGGGGPGTGKRK
jgi:hypothetical protein